MGVWIYDNRKWKELIPSVDSRFVTAMVRDEHGRLFLGRTDGKISIFENNSLRTLSTIPRWIGVIATLSQTSRNVFALGLNGIAVYRGDSFQMLSFVQPELAYTVSGLVESTNGDIFINGSSGIVRIPSTEMQAALIDPSHKIICASIHDGDFIGPATFWKPTPSAIKDIHGRLWFSTLNGVVSFEPETILRSRPMSLRIARSEN
jgi:ligand-binding sensor domain-containing protein